MLHGRAAVFLSCSEDFKERVAYPIREALEDGGVHGIIISEEPLLPHTSSDPDSKVDSYLDASDAFVALCTPDNHLVDGSIECRQNIIDEIQRAKNKPHLRQRIQVFKEATVKLPSNINPVYENLDCTHPSPASDLVLRQLRVWGVSAGDASPVVTLADTPVRVQDMLDGLEIGDLNAATRRAYRLLLTASRDAQLQTVTLIVSFLRDRKSDAGDEVHRASSILEAFNRLDPTLVPITIIEELANAEDFTKRSSAAMMLWERAEVAPAEIPLGLLGKLAVPSREDWYVYAPAMAATKQLLLHRQAAWAILNHLASSQDDQDRYEASRALADVASIDPYLVPIDLAERLSHDPDDAVSEAARQALQAIRALPPDTRIHVARSVFSQPATRRRRWLS